MSSITSIWSSSLWKWGLHLLFLLVMIRKRWSKFKTYTYSKLLFHFKRKKKYMINLSFWNSWKEMNAKLCIWSWLLRFMIAWTKSCTNHLRVTQNKKLQCHKAMVMKVKILRKLILILRLRQTIILNQHQKILVQVIEYHLWLLLHQDKAKIWEKHQIVAHNHKMTNLNDVFYLKLFKKDLQWT